MVRKKTPPPAPAKTPARRGRPRNGKNAARKPAASAEIENGVSEAEEPTLPVTEEWAEIPVDDPLEILEDPTIAVELSEDPVRLYLKEIGLIHLLDADSEFRLAARIEAEHRLEIGRASCRERV